MACTIIVSTLSGENFSLNLGNANQKLCGSWVDVLTEIENG